MIENKTDLTERDSELRRREWLMIYLPLAFGVMLFLALVITMGLLGFREANLGSDPASVWGDTAAIMVIIEVMAVSLLPLALLVALCALVIWMIVRVQPLLRRGQEITAGVKTKVDRAADKATAAMIKPYLSGARLRTFVRLIRR